MTRVPLPSRPFQPTTAQEGNPMPGTLRLGTRITQVTERGAYLRYRGLRTALEPCCSSAARGPTSSVCAFIGPSLREGSSARQLRADSGPDDEGNSLQPRVHLQLGEDVLDVRPGGLGAYHQRLGDAIVVRPLDEERQHVSLTWSEPHDPFPGLVLGPAATNERVDKVSDHVAGYEGPPAGEGMGSFDQLSQRRLVREIPARACLDCIE
jgi:hypothetical protein